MHSGRWLPIPPVSHPFPLPSLGLGWVSARLWLGFWFWLADLGGLALGLAQDLLGRPFSFASCHPRRPPNHSWVEVVASRAPVCGAVLATALDEVFMESLTLARYNEAVVRDPSARLFTFRERCEASGCTCLLDKQLDETRDLSQAAETMAPPAKRIALAAASLRSKRIVVALGTNKKQNTGGQTTGD